MELKNKTLQETFDIVQEYYKVREECAEKRAIVSRNYAGELREREIQKIDSLESAAKSAMESALMKNRDDAIIDLQNKRAAALEKGKHNSLDGGKISPDFALLGLPVTLTGEEMQQLYNKNWDNPLFVRALKDYENTHRGGTPVDYTDAYTRAINAVWKAFIYIENHSRNTGGAQVLRDNPHHMEQLDEIMAEAISTATSANHGKPDTV